MRVCVCVCVCVCMCVCMCVCIMCVRERVYMGPEIAQAARPHQRTEKLKKKANLMMCVCVPHKL